MIKVIDNFLDQYYIDYLEDCVTNQSFEWNYQKNVSTFTEDESGWLHGFSHGLYDPNYGLRFDDSKGQIWIPAILKMEQELIKEKASLIRTRLDMTVKSPENTLHTPHVDLKQPHWTTILYLKDSDGDTVIYNERVQSETYTVQQTVEPKKNRIIFFDGSFYHTGHSPSKRMNRILLNSNFVK
ncbi:DNA endonuclease V [Cyanophage S-RIM12 isolate W1_08_0910]|uniref:DNA endonuclease V n=3 Tax=Brizovirus TaxID=2733098 RepID=A0A1D7SP38_9CAUD|nr:DNA endonuclease V [Cyanophage S-RIM12 isolate RW_06_0310]YP_009779434.1 DNA endonuclease V [Cyanophage S-RIM12 isolate W1_08_0910]AOO15299.1 DNA endonuclease V [Cyanophage S-RIM12_Np_15_0310]AOO15939.1 DNA endonuclease V [Cyanophage S-RIM12_RW_04_0310]AOO19159.1 DNA endonuclease V [Cyanophage S-RIM12_WH_05_0310]AOO16367.1 DNA endonuclease V [Cyanophage S-RIM12 isolate RW_06_0310]AOO18516.1 DNA endonuclease V [Cyanophage S-RIM12 isolate W1_08_0910]